MRDGEQCRAWTEFVPGSPRESQHAHDLSDSGAGDALLAGDFGLKGAYVAVFKGPLGTQGDLDRLFAVGGHWGAVVADFGNMDYTEINLRLDPTRAGSHTVTFGEPDKLTTNFQGLLG